jgi:hypothetical protein
VNRDCLSVSSSIAQLTARPARDAGALDWATWNAAIVVLVAVFILRVSYLCWWSPWQLVGDEAYYWEQARHLDLCYNEKGPALAWLIAVCCRVLGDSEWTVRLPVALSSLLAGWAVGRLAMSVSDGDERVGFVAVAIFCLLPAFQANAQICTQDGPLIALWVMLTAIGLRLIRRWNERENTWREWMLLWLVLGIGCLFKQSIVLFLPSLLVYWMARRTLPIRPVFYAQQAVGLAVFCAVISPMIVWNYRHGWPLVAHTLGHLGVGGDQAGLVNRGNSLTWLGKTIGGLIGAAGPGFVLLAWWACHAAARERESNYDRWWDQAWLMCAALPSIAFFCLLSLIKPVVPSWALPSLAPLVPLTAGLAIARWPQYRVERRARQIGSPEKPDQRFRALWHTLVIYGVAGWLVFSFPTALTHLPVFGAAARKSLKRLTGHREEAAELQGVLAAVKTPDGRPPMLVSPYYMDAALDAFYLPGHPPVATAGAYLGKRSTTFDEWPDTSLENPALRGRTLLLTGGPDVRWEDALNFDRREPIDAAAMGGGRYWLAVNYRGPKHERQSGD